VDNPRKAADHQVDAVIFLAPAFCACSSAICKMFWVTPNSCMRKYRVSVRVSEKNWIISNFSRLLNPLSCCPGKEAGAEAKKGREKPSQTPSFLPPQRDAVAKGAPG